MLKLLLLLYWIPAALNGTARAEFKIPLNYVQQNQHTAFHIFGNAGQSIITNCYFVEKPDYGRCYINLEKDRFNRDNILVDSEVIANLHESFLSRLKQLRTQWHKDHPVTAINQYFFLFRQHDRERLDDLIVSVETEGLFNRFLMPKNHRKVQNIMSSELVEKIFKIYEDTFAPFELR